VVDPLLRQALTVSMIALAGTSALFVYGGFSCGWQRTLEVLIGDRAPSDGLGHLMLMDTIAVVGFLAVPALFGAVIAIVLQWRLRVSYNRAREAFAKASGQLR
jgi:hypothetical protein